MRERFRFLLEAQRAFGVGLMVGAFLLALSDRIGTDTMWFVFALGMVNVLGSAILLPVESKDG